MQKIWQHKSINSDLQKKISHELKIHPVTAQLLINRKITTINAAHQFLNPGIANLHDPFLFNQMPKAVKRIKQAVDLKEKIIIYGDYDVDGICATALLFRFLKSIGANISYYIPHRINEGYGINIDAVKQIVKQKVDLFISVDCGINSFKEVEFLKHQNIAVIITDHHQPKDDTLPLAEAIINPHTKGDNYPDKNLAGVGVAYKLVSAVSGDLCREYLDLAALGTVCDVVPLIGENRVIVTHGIDKMRQSPLVGIKALIDTAGVKQQNIATYHLGYIFGPRINASGRLGSAELALKLLLTDREEEALEIAKILDQKNRTRQQTEEQILKQALLKVEQEVNFKHHRVLVLHDENWHPGVIGIVASRLADRCYRPTLLFSGEDNIARGSGRSIKNFHLFDALTHCEELIKEFGGHAGAVGISIHKNNLDKFREMINLYAERMLSANDLIPHLEVDMEIPLDILNKALIAEIDRLNPFGHGNPQPIFSTKNLRFKGRLNRLKKNGFKTWVTDDKKTCEIIAFRLNTDLPEDFHSFSTDISYTPCLNTWQGVTSLQLQLKDFKLYSF
ncbi:MAG: single-stranded-DNA-specific exonuclease RecJ [Candidatus Omnitrophota bacterium]